MGDYSEFEYPEFGFEKQAEKAFTMCFFRRRTRSQIRFKIMAVDKQTAIMSAQVEMGADWILVFCY